MDAEGHNVRRGDGTQASEVPGLVKDKAKEAKKEEQAGGESAYNEETGEINWDCPVSDIFLTQVDISRDSVMPLASANADVFLSLSCSSPATTTTTITTTTTTTTHPSNPPRLRSASAGWPKAPAVKTSRPPFPVSYTATRNPREWIASKNSRRCRIVSGNIPTFTARVSLRISYLGPSDLIRLAENDAV